MEKFSYLVNTDENCDYQGKVLNICTVMLMMLPTVCSNCYDSIQSFTEYFEAYQFAFYKTSFLKGDRYQEGEMVGGGHNCYNMRNKKKTFAYQINNKFSTR